MGTPTLRAPWTDGRNQYTLSQKQLENIGLEISECSLCREIHRTAKLERENAKYWIVLTHEKDIIEHIRDINVHGTCPYRINTVGEVSND